MVVRGDGHDARSITTANTSGGGSHPVNQPPVIRVAPHHLGNWTVQQLLRVAFQLPDDVRSVII
jgi:hypothetical protein